MARAQAEDAATAAAIARVETRLDGSDQRLGKIESGLDSVNNRIDIQNRWLIGTLASWVLGLVILLLRIKG